MVFPGLPTPKQLHRTLNWDWRLQTTTMMRMRMRMMRMMAPPHILCDTRKSHMAQAALIPLSCISTHQTGLRYSLLPRDFGVSFLQWCLHFQSVVCTKTSFENVLLEVLLQFRRRGPFLSLVSHLITIVWIHWYVWHRVLSKVWETNAYAGKTLGFTSLALTESFLARFGKMHQPFMESWRKCCEKLLDPHTTFSPPRHKQWNSRVHNATSTISSRRSWHSLPMGSFFIMG